MNTIAAAYLLDCIAGDPEWFPHPVRLMGRLAQLSERWLRRPNQSPGEELVAGALLTGGLVGLSWFATTKAIKWRTEILLAWTCLATRSLVDESLAVIRALDQDGLPLARQRLARIVGRDTHALSAAEVHRALIETLAESACDGIVAPLFYMSIGGVPMAMAYKAVNTLDSMIGHADQRYFYFGKAAARLDDAANYIPSRLTALAIVALASRNQASALNVWKRDRNNHKSQNAGQPESAMAGALRVRLGGVNTYAGEPLVAPLLGAEFPPPQLRDAKRAVRLVVAVSLLVAAAAIGMTRWQRVPWLGKNCRSSSH